VVTVTKRTEAPCATCEQAEKCKRLKISCIDFFDWTTFRTRPRKNEQPRREPTAEIYDKIFTVRCGFRKCNRTVRLDHPESRQWGTTRVIRGPKRRAVSMLVDACPRHKDIPLKAVGC
jgi:hypothetical protein